MFKRKKCPRCKRKIDDRYSFCPYCGIKLKEDSRKWGILGRTDYEKFPEGFIMPFNFEGILNNLIRNLNNQIREFDKEIKKSKIPPTRGISISISTSNNRPPKISVKAIGESSQKIKTPIPAAVTKEKKPLPEISEKGLKKLSKLPKKEPATKIKRLADKIIYEINLPGVKSLKDVSIMRLENSIEIKALAEDKAYVKSIPINLPISKYNLERDKLILELETEN